MRTRIKDSPEGQRKGKQMILDVEFPLLRWIPVTPGGPAQHSTALKAGVGEQIACPTFILSAGDEITGSCCPLEAT